MSDIQFCTTPKGYLPHYSCIFSNSEPLGKETKNVACSRLGTMLHLEIQKRKEATKTSNFQKYIRGTAAGMKRLMMYKKGVTNWHQMTPNLMIDSSVERKWTRRRWMRE